MFIVIIPSRFIPLIVWQWAICIRFTSRSCELPFIERGCGFTASDNVLWNSTKGLVVPWNQIFNNIVNQFDCPTTRTSWMATTFFCAARKSFKAVIDLSVELFMSFDYMVLCISPTTGQCPLILLSRFSVDRFNFVLVVKSITNKIMDGICRFTTIQRVYSDLVFVRPWEFQGTVKGSNKKYPPPKVGNI